MGGGKGYGKQKSKGKGKGHTGCFTCGGEHLARDCPKGGGKGQERNGPYQQKTCYTCGKPGHIAAQCYKGGGKGDGWKGDSKGAGKGEGWKGDKGYGGYWKGGGYRGKGLHYCDEWGKEEEQGKGGDELWNLMYSNEEEETKGEEWQTKEKGGKANLKKKVPVGFIMTNQFEVLASDVEKSAERNQRCLSSGTESSSWRGLSLGCRPGLNEKSLQPPRKRMQRNL